MQFMVNKDKEQIRAGYTRQAAIYSVREPGHVRTARMRFSAGSGTGWSDGGKPGISVNAVASARKAVLLIVAVKEVYYGTAI
jgi:hypothetical protein